LLLRLRWCCFPLRQSWLIFFLNPLFFLAQVWLLYTVIFINR
jgi:hypothetical protein